MVQDHLRAGCVTSELWTYAMQTWLALSLCGSQRLFLRSQQIISKYVISNKVRKCAFTGAKRYRYGGKLLL